MENENTPRTLDDYLGVVRGRKAMIIGLAVLVPIVAVLLSSLQASVYSASAEVALQQNDFAATLAGVSGGGGFQADRFTQTQARLARSPGIAREAARKVGPPYDDARAVLRSSSVDPSLDADILTFVARGSTPDFAIGLANAYSRAYVRHANGQESSAIARALALIDQRLADLRATKKAGTIQYADLQDKRQQLQTYDALNTAGAVVTQPAEVATKVSPRITLAAAFGVFIGLVLGVSVAFGLEAVKKPLRSPAELAEEIGLPLLGRIPTDPRKDVVTLTEPNSADAEAYRVLCANLDFVADLHEKHAIVVTSAREGEGKSTVASNLAVTLARRGINVILVDGDVIQPSLQRRFSLPPRLGLTDVAASPSGIDDALAYLPIDLELKSDRDAPPVRLIYGPSVEAKERRAGSASKKNKGQLHVIVTRPVASDAAEVLLGASAERILADLRKRASIVIVDAPPVLTSVGMGWAAMADSLLVVASFPDASRPILEELGRALAQIPTSALGVVVTGTPSWPGYISHYGPPHAKPSAAQRAASP